MWPNRDVVQLIEWMCSHNRDVPDDQRAGFHGLDVYSLWDSLRLVSDYLERLDPELARTARRAHNCLQPYGEDVREYARATAVVPTWCEDEAAALLGELRINARRFEEDGREGFFNAEQNALVAKNAELYYRTMMRGGPGSWNVRYHYMVETLERLMTHHGPDARAVDPLHMPIRVDGEVPESFPTGQ